MLWDIDGTLLQRASEAHAAALLRAVEEVHGLDVSGHRVDAAGRTDRAIARSLLAAAGVDDGAVDGGAERVLAATCAAYEELCPADLRATVAPGIVAALEELAARPETFRFSLVTGNFEPVARLKLARAGIGHHFAPGQGGFGSDAEDRAALPPVARARAGDWPRERTVVVGDTPRDIACARADGVRCVAVTTGRYGPEELAGADVVARDARELRAALDVGR